MDVALYYPWIYVRGGCEKIIAELTARSRHNWTVFTNHYSPDNTFPEFGSIKVEELSPVSVKRTVAAAGLACMKLLVNGGGFERFDALVVLCDGIGNLVTLRAGRVPLVSLCTTPLKVAYDPHQRETWLRDFRPGIATRTAVRVFSWVDRLTWRRYQHIFCVSEEVRQRILRARLAEADRMSVAHPGVDTDALQPTGRREPFFLLPGRIKWYKNTDLGLQAFISFKASCQTEEMRLVVAGMVDGQSGDYLAQLKELAGDRGDIEFLLEPTEEQFRELYDRCTAVLSCCPNEDWGIMPVEAMAFGKPVVAVGRGGTAESVLDGETGFLCEPDPSSFASAMAKLISAPELYAAMSLAARKRAEGLHWRYFVGQIDDYLGSLPVRESELAKGRRDAHRL